MKALLAVVLGMSLSLSLFASDQAREKAHADEILSMLMVGDEVWLSDGRTDFLALLTEAADANGKAVILMHGTGVHPDWADVIFPLREGLAEHGWTTLSIQMPIAAREASYETYLPLFPEVPPRIDAALAYLRELGHDNIVLLGHSLGARMAAYYLANADQNAIKGFAAVGINATDTPPIHTLEYLGKLQLPVLDLYGSADLEAVLETAAARQSASAGNSSYTQIMVEGADHFFRGMNDELLNHVADWLQTLPQGN